MGAARRVPEEADPPTVQAAGGGEQTPAGEAGEIHGEQPLRPPRRPPPEGPGHRAHSSRAGLK